MTVQTEHKICYVSFIKVAAFSQNQESLRVLHEQVVDLCNRLPIAGRNTSDWLVYNLQHQHARYWETFNEGMRATIFISLRHAWFFHFAPCKKFLDYLL